MKKTFFIALAAVLTVGAAALSANADTFYAEGSDDPVTCNLGAATCAQAIPGNVYRVPDSEGQGLENQVPAGELEDYQFIPE